MNSQIFPLSKRHRVVEGDEGLRLGPERPTQPLTGRKPERTGVQGQRKLVRRREQGVMTVTGGDTSFAIEGGQLVFEGAPFYECTKAG